MKRLFPLALVALLFVACGKTETDNADTDATAGSALKVTALLADAEANIDQEMTIEGTVTHVCKHGGRRVHLTDIETNEKIRVEAPEDMPAFARELEGSDIVVTGVLRETRIDAAYLDEWEQEILTAQNEEEAEHDHAGQDLAAHEKEMNETTKEGEDNDGHVEPQGLDAVNAMRAELAESEKGYLSKWHMDCVTYSMTDGTDVPVAKPAEGEEGHTEDDGHQH
ncbi:MAG: hypothetical protein C0600_09950 [Ignavibacteria bacterium]|nr:MAG: hypothetical protein C0600_09950 [Ignavibacteria bacterium]